MSISPTPEDRTPSATATPRRRSRRFTQIAVATLGCAAVLSVAACGSSDDDSSTNAMEASAQFPPVDLSTIISQPASPKEKTEVLHLSSAEMIAATNSGQLGDDWLVPPTIKRMTDPGLEGAATFTFKIRDADKKIVGYGTEQEVWQLDEAGKPTYIWASPWALTFPGRGTLFLEQIEGGSKTPKTTKNADGSTTSRTTSGPLEGDLGRIVGGTGEFEGRTGTFYEEDTTNPKDSTVLVQLHLTYDD